MTRRNTFQIPVLGLGLILICATMLYLPALAQTERPDPANERRLAREINSAIFEAPTLSVFDNIQYQIQGDEVILKGQVVSDTTKHDIEENVKHIEGVTNVIDQIEELPSRPGDQQIRRAEYRAIYGDPDLEKYATGALPPIHIVVDGGHVTLEGVVDNEMDKEVANQRALSVTSAFSVTNHLQIRRP